MTSQAPSWWTSTTFFCSTLFNYLHERFEPTRECLALADGVCSRDLQPKFAERGDGFALPRHVLLFPEYSWTNGPANPAAAPKRNDDEVRIVSVGTICLETQGMYDSCYLPLARMLAAQKIHLHIYPHWFYRNSPGTVFNFDFEKDFADFLKLEGETDYLHVHESLPLDELARELPQYDFGIVSGGCPEFGQKLNFLTEEYMKSCYSGRIADYIDARLPVLINREVAFNDWLLQRYGIKVDLAGVLEPGFRKTLLAIKHDPVMTANMERAAVSLSLDNHAQRLAAFYRDVRESAGFADERAGVRPEPAGPLPKRAALLRSVSTAGGARPKRGPWRWLRDGTRRLWAGDEGFADLEHARNSMPFVHRTQALLTRSAAHEREIWELRAQVGLLQRRSAFLERRLANLRREVKVDATHVDELAGLLNWPEIMDDDFRQNGFPELIRQLAITKATPAGSRGISSSWRILNRKNLDQLLLDGYRNFKRTIGLNYFTFPVQAGDPQIAALEGLVGAAEARRLWDVARSLPDDSGLAIVANQAHYRYMVLLLAAYVSSVDRLDLLDRLEEPADGNPFLVRAGSRNVSQDLLNSLLEYYAISDEVPFSSFRRILEIGPGYGRNAYVNLNLHPRLQYTMVDIPPALYVAQRYLSEQFPQLGIFQARNFDRFDDVQEEMENASIVFLLPHQLQKLPPQRFDLALNISSFGEMTRPQIEHYFGLVDRLTKGHFFTKQWQELKNPFDQLVLNADEYPVGADWHTVFKRPCKVQPTFFEALYRIGEA